MPALSHTVSFNLPSQQAVKVHLVRLADGSVVARTEDELQALPDELAVPLADLVPPKPGV